MSCCFKETPERPDQISLDRLATESGRTGTLSASGQFNHSKNMELFSQHMPGAAWARLFEGPLRPRLRFPEDESRWLSRSRGPKMPATACLAESGAESGERSGKLAWDVSVCFGGWGTCRSVLEEA